MVVDAFNPSIQEVEEEDLHCLKTQTKTKTTNQLNKQIPDQNKTAKQPKIS